METSKTLNKVSQMQNPTYNRISCLLISMLQYHSPLPYLQTIWKHVSCLLYCRYVLDRIFSGIEHGECDQITMCKETLDQKLLMK